MADVVIPEVALVHRVPHSWSAPWVPGSIPRRPLPVRRQVKVEAEVKVSSCEKLLDSLDVLLELLRLLYGLAVCWIERNKLSSHHLVDVGALNACHMFLLCDDNEEVMAHDVHDP